MIQNALLHYRLPLYDRLAARGLEVSVVHGGAPSGHDGAFEEIVTDVRVFGGLHWHRRLPRLADFDTVVSMFDLHWPRCILPAFGRRRFRLVFWGHGLGRQALGNRLRVWLANRADAVLLYGERGAADMRAAGVDPDRIHIAHNTVAVDNHGPGEIRRQDFLFVGRLHARKRVDLLLRAFADFLGADAARQARFVIVGDGPERPALAQLAAQLGIAGRVEFTGEVTDNDRLRPLFHRSIAYVCPGWLGLGVNHALAFGTPVLWDAHQPHAPEVELLGAHNAVTIPRLEGDAARQTAFARAMGELADDPERVLRLARGAYADYCAYGAMDRMVDGYAAAVRGTRTP